MYLRVGISFLSVTSLLARDPNIFVYKWQSIDWQREKLIVLILMQITLGAPWVRLKPFFSLYIFHLQILQYFSLFSPNLSIWHYLFTIVNGSQGILLGVLHLYRHIKCEEIDVSNRYAMTTPIMSISIRGHLGNRRKIYRCVMTISWSINKRIKQIEIISGITVLVCSSFRR